MNEGGPRSHVCFARRKRKDHGNLYQLATGVSGGMVARRRPGRAGISTGGEGHYGFKRRRRKDTMKLFLALLLAFALSACASRHEPKVSAEDAAASAERPEQLPERTPLQTLAIIFELIPGANFFLIPLEYSLTGTTGL